MLAHLNQLLPPARAGGYAVGLFNVVTLEQAEGVFLAAQQSHAPLIIGTAEAFLKSITPEAVFGMLRAKALQSELPVALHFDHGRTFEGCMRALRLGCTSVMYDCSALPYERNISEMAEMCRIAHAMGATVEGELGSVGGSEDGTENIRTRMTDPRQAADFVRRTGVDALAVAVGNAHGQYTLPPKLDFELIREIAAQVPVPLVLHGGSGLTDQDFTQAIRCGIAKVNIFTDLNMAQARAAQQALAEGKNTAMAMIPQQMEAVRAVAAEKMRLFGCTGKASAAPHA